MKLFSRRQASEIPKTAAVAPIDEDTKFAILAVGFKGVGKRSGQEDSYAIVNGNDVIAAQKKGLFAVVADGMGGMAGGDVASSLVVHELCAAFESLNQSESPTDQLFQAVMAANDAVFSRLEGRGGSTLIACLIRNGSLYYVSVGDSVLYLLRGGKLSRLNRPQNCLHKAYLETVSSGSFDPKPARSGPEQRALSQFVGMRQMDDMDILLRPLKLFPGDTLLICSDGVTDALDEEAITGCLNRSKPRAACDLLEAGIIRKNRAHQDNYTGIVIQCGS